MIWSLYHSVIGASCPSVVPGSTSTPILLRKAYLSASFSLYASTGLPFILLIASDILSVSNATLESEAWISFGTSSSNLFQSSPAFSELILTSILGKVGVHASPPYTLFFLLNLGSMVSLLKSTDTSPYLECSIPALIIATEGEGKPFKPISAMS